MARVTSRCGGRAWRPLLLFRPLGCEDLPIGRVEGGETAKLKERQTEGEETCEDLPIGRSPSVRAAEGRSDLTRVIRPPLSPATVRCGQSSRAGRVGLARRQLAVHGAATAGPWATRPTPAGWAPNEPPA